MKNTLKNIVAGMLTCAVFYVAGYTYFSTMSWLAHLDGNTPNIAEWLVCAVIAGFLIYASGLAAAVVLALLAEALRFTFDVAAAIYTAIRRLLA